VLLLNSTQENNQSCHNYRVGTFRQISIQIKIQVGKQRGQNSAGFRVGEEEIIINRNIFRRIIYTRLEHLNQNK
jgi:hypothetical protein